MRAILEYTELKSVPALVVEASDIQARRIAAAENFQREDLTAIEEVEAIVELVDAELIDDKEYASMGKNPADRMKTLLGKLHSITNSKNRGSQVSKKADLLLYKFVQQVGEIFKNLPKPLEWRNFSVAEQITVVPGERLFLSKLCTSCPPRLHLSSFPSSLHVPFETNSIVYGSRPLGCFLTHSDKRFAKRLK